MELFEALGINWKILLGQIINFLLILYLLKRFALKPFLKILGDRKEIIEKGVQKSEEAERKIQTAEVEREKILKDGQERVNSILRQSEERGKEKEEKILKEAEEEKQRIIKEAGKLGKIEIGRLKEDFSKKNLEFVLNFTEKILKEKIDLKKNEEITKNFLLNFKNDKD